MFPTKNVKVQYSETEAAERLGISVEQLRHLVKSHIVKEEEDVNSLEMTSFLPSDLAVLKILATMHRVQHAS